MRRADRVEALSSVIEKYSSIPSFPRRVEHAFSKHPHGSHRFRTTSTERDRHCPIQPGACPAGWRMPRLALAGRASNNINIDDYHYPRINDQLPLRFRARRSCPKTEGAPAQAGSAVSSRRSVCDSSASARSTAKLGFWSFVKMNLIRGSSPASDGKDSNRRL